MPTTTQVEDLNPYLSLRKSDQKYDALVRQGFLALYIYITKMERKLRRIFFWIPALSFQ